MLIIKQTVVFHELVWRTPTVFLSAQLQQDTKDVGYLLEEEGPGRQ